MNVSAEAIVTILNERAQTDRLIAELLRAAMFEAVVRGLADEEEPDEIEDP